MGDGPKLIRRDGVYSIVYEGKQMQIEEWEAMAIMENHDLVYDVIVSYNRKFNFNTTQDNVDFI